MARAIDSRTPICLVTGFLGSGKTTFLKQTATRYREHQLVYIVNEFSPHDIDGAFVSRDTPDVVSIPGGSIFCRCLAGEFIRHFATIQERFGAVEGIVVEASGMANPTVIGDMLRETRLDDRFVLSTIVAVVDPGSFEKLRVTLPGIVHQIEAADTVLINKLDLYSPAVIDQTARAVQSINPAVRLHTCSHAATEIELFAPPDTESELHGEYALCRDPNYATTTVRPAASVTMEELTARVAAAGDGLYRAKGYLQCDGEWVRLDYSKSGLSFTAEPDHHEPAVVFITKSDPSGPARDLVTWLSSETANPRR